jgi:selenocysteine lyase/cysteine desulfurase
MDQDWQAGDHVITSSFEHHALFRNLVKLKSRGIEITEINPTSDSLFDLESFESELRNRKTKLVAITAACNVTGGMLPYEEITSLSHHHGAKVLIDGAQIAGWADLDLKQLGVDFFTFAGHKGPQAPWGIGGLYVSEGATMSCPTATCEIGSSSGAEEQFEAKPGYCDAGSVDLIALAGLAAGCKWLAAPEQNDRLYDARKNAADLAHAFRDMPGATIHHDLEPEQKMPTVAVSLGIETQVVPKRLKENNIIASSGFQCAPLAHQALDTNQTGVIRFSYGPAQNQIDIDRLIAAVFDV